MGAARGMDWVGSSDTHRKMASWEGDRSQKSLSIVVLRIFTSSLLGMLSSFHSQSQSLEGRNH